MISTFQFSSLLALIQQDLYSKDEKSSEDAGVVLYSPIYSDHGRSIDSESGTCSKRASSYRFDIPWNFRPLPSLPAISKLPGT